jgi:hypothetical protein
MARRSAKTEVTPPGTDVELHLSHLSAHIAAELAAGLSDSKSIRERYGITDAQWEILKKNPSFRAMVKEAIEKFAGDLNAGKRILVKSEIALEDSIEVLYRLAHRDDVQPGARIDAIKTMAQLAGKTGKEGQGGNAGTGFSINIQFTAETGEQKGVVIDGQALPAPEGT